MKGRNYYLDVVRIIACLMVVMMHSPVAIKEGESSLIPSIISILMLPCNGLFFMTSGALLLDTEMVYCEFLKKHFLRIGCPLIIWSIVYVLVDAVFFDVSKEYSIKQLLWIPFHYVNSNNTLWFMYALGACYFIVPIIAPWLRNATKKELNIVLFLWIFSNGISMITFYLGIPESGNLSIYYYFGGFIGYLVLGWYMNKYDCSLLQIIISFVFAILFYVVVRIQAPQNWSEICYSHSSTICFSFGLFGMIKKLASKEYSEKTQRVLYSLSGSSFGVYLIHVLFLSKIIKNTDLLSGFSVESAIAIRWLLTVVVCFSIIYILKKIPFSKYVVG